MPAALLRRYILLFLFPNNTLNLTMELRSSTTEVDSGVESGYLQCKLSGNTKRNLEWFFFLRICSLGGVTPAATKVVNTARTQTVTCTLRNLLFLSLAIGLQICIVSEQLLSRVG